MDCYMNHLDTRDLCGANSVPTFYARLCGRRSWRMLTTCSATAPNHNLDRQPAGDEVAVDNEYTRADSVCLRGAESHGSVVGVVEEGFL
jgi:hypothetical protein